MNNEIKLKIHFWKKRFRTLCLLLVAIAVFILSTNTSVVEGQPELLKLDWFSRAQMPPVANSSSIDTSPIKLDGYKLFVITAPKISQQFPLEQRVTGIEESLNRFANSKFEPNTLQVTANLDNQSGLPIIKIDGQYLMTVTTLDAEIQGLDPQAWASQLTPIIRAALVRAKQERQVPFLLNRSLIAVGILLLMTVLGRLINYGLKNLKGGQEAIKAQIDDKFTSEVDSPETLLQKISKQQQINVSYLQRRALQLSHLGLWGCGIFVILGLFSYTRWLQSYLLSQPLQILVIGLGTYLLIRVTDVLTDRFLGFLKAEDFATLKTPQRLELRISTVSQALKNVNVIVLVGIGTLAGLSVIGVDLIPLLAGAGIIGLAISFAAQGLIKDVINGFLIILEDQYAVGDVIVVGNLGGFVENMNLRITKVRNNEGQLITIPNSSISIVQNLSKDWARVDLTIQISYDTNPDHALEVLKELAENIYSDRSWHHKILEAPEVLGIDDLQHTGMLIRIWIKTQPLQQWAVAREFRRRLKLVMEQEGITIGIPHQSLWVKNTATDIPAILESDLPSEVEPKTKKAE